MKTGRNDPCPCGSGKKHKKCCLGKDAAPPSPASAIGERLRQRLGQASEAGEPLSEEALDALTDEVMTDINASGLAEFAGLSPNDMQELLNCGFHSCSLVTFPDRLDTDPAAPVITLFEAIRKGINDGARATAKGNLPRRLVQDAAAALQAVGHSQDFFGTELRLRGEDDFEELKVTRLLCELAGLIQLNRGCFELTPRCQTLLADDDCRRIYPVLLQTYAMQFNWAYRDGYADFPGIQQTAPYSLYLLFRFGDQSRSSDFYEQAFLEAFPMIEQETTGTSYLTPRKETINAYRLRTLNRFAAFFGLIDIDSSDEISEFTLNTTPLFHEAVSFGTMPNITTAGDIDTRISQQDAFVWQGKRVGMGYIEQEQSFAVTELWLDVSNDLIVHHELKLPDSEGISDDFQQLIARDRPDGLHVADRAWADELRAAFPDLSIHLAPTGEIDEVAESLLEAVQESESGAVPYLSGDIDAATMTQCFDTVAGLYRVAPWDYMADWQCVTVDIPSLNVNGACLSVIGSDLGEPGFLLFSSRAGFTAMARAMEDIEQGLGLNVGEDFLSLTYERGADLPLQLREEVRQHSWQVADGLAYPVFTHHGPDGSPRNLAVADLKVIAACASAIGTLIAEKGEAFLEQEIYPLDTPLRVDGSIEVWFR